MNIENEIEWMIKMIRTWVNNQNENEMKLKNEIKMEN